MSHNEHKGKLVHAISWAVVSNIASQGIVSAITLVLASLLKPADFGLVSMALIYLGFVQMVLGFGFSSTLIQRRDLEQHHLDSVFWVIVIASLILGAVTLMFSGWWAAINHMPELKSVMVAMAILVPIEGLSVVQQAVLQREMDFKSLALRTNSAAIIGGVVGIVLALLGFGVWALVLQCLTRDLTSVVMLWTVSSWRPGFNFSFSYVRSLTRFSTRVFAGQLGAFAMGQTDSLLVGMVFGPTAVGLYRLADRLVEMVLSLVTRAFQVVSLPHLSKIQHDTEELNKGFAFLCKTSGMVTIPAIMFLGAMSSQIMAALGPQWRPAAIILRIFCAIGIVKAITSFIGPLLQAVSKPGISAWNVWSLAVMNGLAVITATLLWHSPSPEHQVVTVAILRASMYTLVFLPLNLFQAYRCAGVHLGRIARSLAPAFLIGALVVIAGVVVSNLCASFNPYVILILSAIVAAAVWLTMVVCLEKDARRTVVLAWERKALRFS